MRFATKYPTQVEIWTNGPSLPRHIPVETANVAPIALTTRTLRSKKFGITKPDRMVFISGIPDPAAIYMLFPATVGCIASACWFLSPVPGEVAGSERFVSIVTLPLIIPKAKAKPTYMAKDEV